MGIFPHIFTVVIVKYFLQAQSLLSTFYKLLTIVTVLKIFHINTLAQLLQN